MQNRASFLGEPMRATLEAMQTWWNRPPFRLHYVTAREAYNIARAAEAGHSGNPNDYRDFEVPPPANRVVLCDRPWLLLSHSARQTHVRVEGEGPCRMQFAGRALRELRGRIREVEVHFDGPEPIALRLDADGPVQVEPGQYRELLLASPGPASTTGSAPGLHQRQ
jgi:hypothetical protein